MIQWWHKTIRALTQPTQEEIREILIEGDRDELARLVLQLWKQHAKEKKELVTVLEKIASLRYSNTSAASIAQSALDTMRVLEKP